jgi:hypothetical protein
MKLLFTKNNRGILFVLFTLFYLGSNSQGLTEKYWYYRDRMFSGFMIMGDGLGYSNIAGIRNYNKSFPEKPESIDLHYGQHSIYMGWYIGVLATEYALLKSVNLSTEKTVTELYYALKAIDRLDALSGQAPPVTHINNFPQDELICPQLFQQQTEPDGLNGFFIRDDVPYAFINPLINSYNYNAINARVNDFDYDEVDFALSDYIAGNKHWNPYTLDSADVLGHNYAKEMSQDELYHLMMGLALVKHFVEDEYLIIKKTDGTYILDNLNLRARNFVTRAVSRIALNGWVIINPNTGWLVHQGPCPGPLIYGLAKACEFITGESYLSFINTPLTLAIASWQGFVDDNAALHANSSAVHMVAVLAAMGNSFTSINPLVSNSEATANRINDICNNYDWETFYCTLRATLHGGPNPISASKLLDQLNTAPCQGPFNTGGSNFVSGWASSHRFFHVRDENDNGNVGSFTGYYNGLDYMLLHNLNYLNNLNGYNNPSFDKFLTSPVDDYPQLILNPFSGPPFITYGDANIPANIEAIRNITASNVINSNAVVTYKAGQEIIFTDEFEVAFGAEFHAYIESYNCAYAGVAPPNNGDSHENEMPKEYASLKKFNRFPDSIDKNTTESYAYPVTIKSPVTQYRQGTSLYTNQKTDEIKCLLSPNPNTGIFSIYVQTLNEQEQLQLHVIDVYGKQLLAQQINNAINHQIDLSAYSKGIYYVSVTGNSGFREVKKVVVN